MEENKNQAPPVVPKKKRKKVWWIVGGVVLAWIVIAAALGDRDLDKIAEADEEIAEEVKTPEYSQEQIDSMMNEVKKLSVNFTTKTDEFKNVTWVKHKNEPKTRSHNGAYMYFQETDGTPTNLRLVLQYSGSDWLFVKKVIFLINGQTFEYDLKFERDNYGGSVYEWADVSCQDIVFLAYLRDADTVKYRLEGNQYTKDYTLPQKDLKAMQQTLEYYMLLEAIAKNTK